MRFSIMNFYDILVSRPENRRLSRERKDVEAVHLFNSAALAFNSSLPFASGMSSR